ncbi:MAG: S1C family serine protease [Halobacteriaceae archaeon]
MARPGSATDRTDDGVGRRHVLGLAAAATASLAGCQTATRDGTTTVSPGDPGTTAGSGPDATGSLPAGTAGPYTEVYRQAHEAVAVVRTGSGQGSCFAYDDRGHFVTNHHVVAGADSVHLHFSRDDWREATVVGTDVFSDLAVLDVDDPPAYVHPLPVLEGSPAVGQRVAVLGTPFGFQGSLTAGVVSGIDRAINSATEFPIPGAVQTDAAANPGNSGGPILTLDATVAGVISRGGGDNIAFGIPPQLVQRVIPALIADGEYEHPYVGVTLTEVGPTIAAANDMARPTGVIVATVIEGGPADGHLEGSQVEVVDGREIPVGGDVIVGLDGRPITSMAELSTHLAFRKSPGEQITVRVLRDGAEQTVTFELGERPEAV